MRIAGFIEELRQLGVALWVEGGQLRYRGPASALTPALLARMQTDKNEILAWLQAPSASSLAFSLLFFASDETTSHHNKYRLLTQAARFGDESGFQAIWLPERHFHAFGGLYPAPAVLAAALATQTRRIRLRAGSVVLPLHHPLRVAEEWSVVDNLSGGRVDLAFAQGWNARDFVLAPDVYADRLQVMHRSIDQVRALWRGEQIELRDGQGQPASVRIYPQPEQAELETWLTCSGGPERFAEAGERGHNVLTALLFQTPEQLAAKIDGYRRARRAAGHAGPGKVTLMLHAFVGPDVASVKAIVREPFIAYLESSVDLWRQHMVNLNDLEAGEKRQMLEYAFERYFESAALFGDVGNCAIKLRAFEEIGVDEVALLLDFGVNDDSIISHLPYLAELKQQLTAAETAPA